MRGRCPLSCLLLAAAMPAQTFVVDAAAGPGSQFTTLVAAVGAAPDGAVIQVRSGSYAGFLVAGKGLSILADPGVTITSLITWQNTGPGQQVTLRGLDWGNRNTATTPALELLQCGGAVLLEDLTVTGVLVCTLASPSSCQRPAGITATRCPQVLVRGCTVAARTTWTDAGVVLDGSLMTGEDRVCGGFPVDGPGQPAVVLTNSSLQVAGGSVLRGGSGNAAGRCAVASGAGVTATGSVVRVLDGLVEGGLQGGFLSGYAIFQSASQVDVSPRAALTSASPFGVSNGTVVVRSMPGATADSAPLGGTLTAGVTGDAGDVVAVLLGLLGAPVLVPGLGQPLWIDPTAFLFHSFGLQPSVGTFAASLPVPNVPALVGAVVTWQAVASGPQTGLQASNPSIGLVR